MDIDKMKAKLELRELIYNLPPVVYKDKETRELFKKFMELYNTLTGLSYPISLHVSYSDPKTRLYNYGYDEVTLENSRNFYLTGSRMESSYGVEHATLGDWHDFLQYMTDLTHNYLRKRWLPPEEEKDLDTPLMKLLRDLGIGA